MYLEKFRLNGRTAVVTGGGQGIGLACAEALAEAGAKVIIADRDSDAAEAGSASLRAKGLAAEAVIMDVTDSARVAEVADQLAARLRREKIHRAETLELYAMDRAWLAALAAQLERRMEFALTVSDRQVYLSRGADTLTCTVERIPIGSDP